jgi:hypothetical protein
MTLREYMKKPITRVSRYSGLVMIGLAAGLAHSSLSTMVFTLVIWGIFFIVAILLMQRRTRCPNCKTKLGALGRAATKDGATLAVCPHCGVDFDEPMKRLDEHAESANPKP